AARCGNASAEALARRSRPTGQRSPAREGAQPRRIPMTRRSRAIAFDVDAASLASLQEALSGWQIEPIARATVASLSPDWDPGVVDLLVVGGRDSMTETLGLCRFLAFCTSY